MRLTKWSIVIIFALGLMILNIWLNVGAKKTVGPISKEVIGEENNSFPETQGKEENLQVPPFLPKIEGVTILGVKEKKEEDEREIGSSGLTLQKEDRAWTQPVASLSENTAAGQVIPPAAGITKEGKKPSQKQTQEMNSKGIVIY